MSGWPELVSAALLGTERRPAPDGDRGLMASAGVAALRRRAGWRAPHAPTLPPAAPPEQRRTFTPAPGRVEELTGRRSSLLEEWLAAAERHGRLVAPELAPLLLDLATPVERLHAAVAAVTGQRGAWLAGLNPRWAWATPLPDEEEARQRLWETGERAVRRRLFRHLRRTDPAAARGLLEGSWSSETADDRAWFVEALGDGLGADDEPFLERTLDDRSARVRPAAAARLACLPESALAARMAARTLPLVRVAGGLRKKLELAPPEELDEAAVRDGIVREPPTGTGRKTFWLAQMLTSTPLHAWAAAGLTPAMAASLPVAGAADAPVFRSSLARAAAAQRNAEWAAALLEQHPDPGTSFLLLSVLPPQQQLAYARDRLRRGDASGLQALPRPWPRDLSELALQQALAAKLVQPAAAGLLTMIAYGADPAIADAAMAAFQRFDSGTAEARRADGALDVLHFRRDMYEELR